MRGLVLIAGILVIYIFSGLMVYGEQSIPEFPRLYINLNRFSYRTGGAVWDQIANFFTFLANVITGVFDIIVYIASVLMWMINIVTASATFSWIPEPFNWMIAVPINAMLVVGFIMTIKDLLSGWL